MLLVLSDKGKGMQSSSEQPLVEEEHCATTLITAAKETNQVLPLKLNLSKELPLVSKRHHDESSYSASSD